MAMEEALLKHKAVIFDMDGVVLDSEGFWAQAEYEVFTSLGVEMKDELRQLTRTMTTFDASKFWYEKNPWPHISIAEVEQRVVSRVVELIKTEDCKIANIRAFIEHLRSKGYKIGLATNSPESFIPLCLERAGIADLFDAVSSAEFEINGKPHPDVYLTTARKLNVQPDECIVIEDSYHGLMAGKRAGMTVIAFTNGDKSLYFDIADYTLHSYSRDGW